MKNALAAWMIRRSLKEKLLPLAELERNHSCPEEAFFNDSSYFLGRGEDGACMVVRMAFRGQRPPEFWLDLDLPGLGRFALKELDATEGDGFSLGPLSFTCIKPGRTWEIGYRGSIHQGEEVHELDLELTFEGTRPLVNFKHITDPEETAGTIAAEKWSRAFFRRLKEIKKTHLEQGGRLSGRLILDGEEIPVNWRSIRDHSWGTRSWETWKRHVWLGGMLDNGEAFNLSMITFDFMGQLSAGYMTLGEELVYLSKLPDMESFAPGAHFSGETRIPFLSRDGREHELSFTIPTHFDFLMDGVYFIREGMGDFLLDGVPGLGVAEFGFNTGYYDTSNL